MIEDITSGNTGMNSEVKHFVLTPEGTVREFSADVAARVASGQSTLPEYAATRLRYLQIALDQSAENEIRVHAGVACLQFDEKGAFSGAEAPSNENDQVDPFEYDACIQWALRETGSTELVYH
jgi:hypothetical protein